MRIQTLILCLLFCVASVFAKDVITKTDGSKIDAKVEEITENVIKYRKASNPTGPAYTIPISSVATVLYENGDIDTFNASNASTNTTTVSSNQTASPSDEELMRMTDSQRYDNQSGIVTDAQLLKMYNEEVAIPQEVKSKVKSYRTIGWIGGGTFLAAGLATGLILYHNEDYYDTCGIWIGVGAIAGGAWWYIYQRKANRLIKQATQMQSYSAMLIENEIMQFGNKSLTAGINLMGNRMVNSHSLGLSLRFNF